MYIDDIIVFAKTLEDHLRITEKNMKQLENAGLKYVQKKCSMLQKEVQFLGHVINGDVIKTSPKKTEAVANWPVSTKVTEVRAFLGLCSYYRRFLKNFAITAKPLHALTGKYARFQ